ncbi:helix-turn-helix domain-containing protein [Aquimarina sp. AD1]|uniref:helix-turn-helix domain-containing protein n=1 Tax=Aquimarina sp. (strain AD1) TaxID=1714848 RepID=UPI000E4F6444|nr:helix-turn-helix domain-containing protein [Aquimarina sp. AD1]AXT58010.1 helix-turn-helix domain-containing protein [Aquimarina sp. AD1]
MRIYQQQKKKNNDRKLLCLSISFSCLIFFTTLTAQVNISIDSLHDKTLEELEKSYNLYRGDSLMSKIYANSYLKKAKKEKDELVIANGYKLLSEISENSLKIDYLDSIIHITKDKQNKKFPSLAYLRKGVYYFNNLEYNKALNLYLEALKFAKINRNKFYEIAIKHNIGLLKKNLGEEKEALALFKENLNVIKSDTNDIDLKGSLNSTLFAISDSFLRLKFPDSAKKYIHSGLAKSHKSNDKDLYTSFLALNGIQNRMQNNYKKAIDSLIKAKVRIEQSNNYDANKTIIYLQIAKVLLKINRENEAVSYLKKIDFLTNDENFSIDIRDSYELLIDYYRRSNDKDNQIKYLNKLIHFDSVFNINNKNIKSNIVRHYDYKELINERNTAINQLKKSKGRSDSGIILSFLIIFLLLVLIFFYYRKKKIYQSKFEKLIEEKKIVEPQISYQEENNISKVSSELDIDEEIVKDILYKLKTFEEKNRFLKSGLKMDTLAKSFCTNSTYLSKIININKQKNFSQYINDLRINFCINKLRNDPKFRLYSIKAIAFEVGFTSIQSFNRAFLKQTGIHASYFIKKIDNQ